ncbi:MAG: hypothetical protein U9P12_10610 [Verrucomicrobiota bacterium]|nr:hypothetical protein [Verrucomicrobiota bacterium]
MAHNLLRIVWFLLLAAGLACGAIVWPEISRATRWGLLPLVLFLFIGWSYLTLRLGGFSKRLFAFLRLLLAGDYEAGIRPRLHLLDEVSKVETLANDLAERLRTYDRLRADRVSILARVLDLTLAQSQRKLITADLDKETFAFNPATQKQLGIERKSFSFESVLKAPANAAFDTLFQQAVQGRKVETEGQASLQLPGMQSPVPLSLQIRPLRDRDETVRFALLTIE